MPDITLCADQCTNYSCIRHIVQHDLNDITLRGRSYAHLKGTEYCPLKEVEDEQD